MTAETQSANRPGSLQHRLGLGVAIGVTAIWLAATVAAGFVVRHELDEAFDSSLRETAHRLLPLALPNATATDATAGTRRVAALDRREEYLSYAVRDRSGKLLLASHDADIDALPATPATGFRTFDGYRLYGASASNGGPILEVAEPLSHRVEAAAEASATFVYPLAIMIPLSLAGAWWFVRRSMRPVVGFRDEIERRGGGDLSAISGEELPAELAPVADSVNRLLDRLRRALEAERSFTANSAHELRTPVASTLAQVQRLVAEAPEGALRERARNVENSLHRLARLSEKLLQLSKAEGGGLLSPTPHDPSVVLSLVVDEFRHGANESRLTLALPETEAATSHIDPDAFAILMRNLVENALKHGEQARPVTVSLVADGTVRVVNSGPPVPAATLSRLRGRFERGKETRTPGAGLGLAIADIIAAGAGADLDLISPASGRDDGFEAVLRLPA